MGEKLAGVGVDIIHAVFPRDLGQIRDPLDATGLLEVFQRLLGTTARVQAIATVIDDEVKLRPVLRRLADVPHVAVRQQLGELLFDRWGKKPLVDTHVDEAGLYALLVKWI